MHTGVSTSVELFHYSDCCTFSSSVMWNVLPLMLDLFFIRFTCLIQGKGRTSLECQWWANQGSTCTFQHLWRRWEGVSSGLYAERWHCVAMNNHPKHDSRAGDIAASIALDQDCFFWPSLPTDTRIDMHDVVPVMYYVPLIKPQTQAWYGRVVCLNSIQRRDVYLIISVGYVQRECVIVVSSLQLLDVDSVFMDRTMVVFRVLQGKHDSPPSNVTTLPCYLDCKCFWDVQRR